ncbi:MAG TPA: hypothetical protein VF221_21835, partial [Chloroflexota bacterium]
MIRPLIAGALLFVLTWSTAHAASTRRGNATTPYAPSIRGVVSGFRLAGIEPDGDPLDQVVLQTRLSSSNGLPPIHLIVDSYLENFTPDTTPVLPDLLNPSRTAQNLGGFLQGKVLLTDDAGNVVALGSFLAEAFIGDSSNHTVMRLYGSGTGYSGKGALKGSFILHKDGTLAGTMRGHLTLPAAARRQILQHRNPGVTVFRRTLLNRIIGTVTVRPAPMMGKATTGSVGAPLHTGYSKPKSQATPSPTAVP